MHPPLHPLEEHYLSLTRRRFFGMAAHTMGAGLGTLALSSLVSKRASADDRPAAPVGPISIGPQLAPNHPNWVSYLVRRQNGTWERSTVYTVPANTDVHVTIYNYDGASGLRNPFLGQPQGLVGPELVDGKPVVDYTEPAGSPTRLTGGTIALQGHDPQSEVHYRSVRIRPLPPSR